MFKCLLIVVSILSVLLGDDVTGVPAYTRKRSWNKKTSTTTRKSTETTTEMKVFPWNTLQYYETIDPSSTVFPCPIVNLRCPNGTDPPYYYPNRTEEERAAFIAQRKGRANNTDWCRCRRCPAMRTDEDSVCCRDDYYFNRLTEFLLGDECTCYSETALTYMALRKIDLDQYRGFFLPYEKRHLEAVYNVEFRNKTNRLWRWLAYRYLIRGVNLLTPWDQGRFNKTVPACVVRAVREEYPETDGVYPDTGWSVFGSIRLPG
ncbi:hypothetical protein M8J77_002614 [Diaphorina citri]|nr:hypothetical protein M8J77_002614 [Diaphorina citri]